jgi:SPP1 family predicted phage head-tail adaptor
MGRIAAGELTQRITLITLGAPVPETDRGGSTPGPSVEQSFWAKVEPLSGGEVLALGQVANYSAWRITLRDQPLILRTPKQRVRWNGETLNVQRVVNDYQQKEYVILTCFNSGK